MIDNYCICNISINYQNVLNMDLMCQIVMKTKTEANMETMSRDLFTYASLNLKCFTSYKPIV